MLASQKAMMVSEWRILVSRESDTDDFNESSSDQIIYCNPVLQVYAFWGFD